MSAPYLSGLGLYDMERIEVFRGPQNSLFGRNKTCGSVNYISAKPALDVDHNSYLNVNLGNFGLTELQTVSTFELSDAAAVRVEGIIYQRDGIWNNLSKDGKSLVKKIVTRFLPLFYGNHLRYRSII